MNAWIFCFSIGFAMFLVCAAQAAPRDKFLTGDGKLTETLTLKDGQGGFAGGGHRRTSNFERNAR